MIGTITIIILVVSIMFLLPAGIFYLIRKL
jgi:hypothetical protein